MRVDAGAEANDMEGARDEITEKERVEANEKDNGTKEGAAVAASSGSNDAGGKSDVASIANSADDGMESSSSPSTGGQDAKDAEKDEGKQKEDEKEEEQEEQKQEQEQEQDDKEEEKEEEEESDYEDDEDFEDEAEQPHEKVDLLANPPPQSNGGESIDDEAGAGISAEDRATEENSLHIPESPSAVSPPRRSKGSRSSANETVPRRFRLSVDLRSIKNIGRPGTIYAKYTYPEIGATSAVRTRPPVRLSTGTEVLLPHGYCMFDFGMTPRDLQSLVSVKPLAIEVWIKDKYKNDELLGIATIPLAQILQAKQFFRDPKTRKTYATLAMLRSQQKASSKTLGGRVVIVRAHDQYYTILTRVGGEGSTVAKKGPGHQRQQSEKSGRFAAVGSMRVVVFLEDLGAVQEASQQQREASVQRGRAAHTLTSQGETTVEYSGAEDAPNVEGVGAERPRHDAGSTPFHNALAGSVSEAAPGQYDPKLDPVNQEAIMKWFAKEYEEFEIKLKEKEGERMAELEHEWAVQSQARAKALSDAQSQYSLLESRLRHKLDMIEARERQLQMKELELNRKADVNASELRLKQRRLEEEMQHKISIERRRADDFQKQVQELQRARKEAEHRAKRVDDDYAKFRAEQRRTPVAQLQAKIAAMTVKCAELSGSLAAEKSAKEREEREKMECQSQIARLVRELQAVRREQRLAAERGIEQLRLQYLAREEKFILDGDRDELRSIRNELDALRRTSVAPSPSRPGPMVQAVGSSGVPHDNKREVARLQNERSTLLATGVYDEQHPIIAAIDAKIKSATQL